MNFKPISIGMMLVVTMCDSTTLCAVEPPSLAAQPNNRWIKRSPIPNGPVSPRLGYEGACVWDSWRQLLIRYGGHNQGGGGEQGSEIWTYDLKTGQWTLKEPNTSPPGVCCNKQNTFDPITGRYIRFPKFSGSHGWQWWREIYLNDSSVWTYDLGENRWRNMRPFPNPRLAPYRCASWDSDQQVAVVFGGEGGREGTLIYDPWRNQWRKPKPDVEPAARSGGSMAYDAARKVHVMFGSQFIDDPHTWTYDVAKNQWTDTKPDTMPPTSKNDPELIYDPANQVVLALIKVTTEKDDQARHDIQTWSYDAGANQWTRLNPTVKPDPAGNRTRNLVFAPELNLAILENCTGRPREQQIWTYRYASAKPQATDAIRPKTRSQSPAIVDDVVASVIAANRVELHWKPSSIDGARYQIERAIVEVWTDDQLVRLKKNTPPLAQPSVGALRSVGMFKQLTSEPVSMPAYIDQTINLAEPVSIDGEAIYESNLHRDHLDRSGRAYPFGVYAYRVRCVDPMGRVSGPSPAVFTIPASPQHLFSREEASTCQLKWQPNDEKGLAGYRIYRLDGRWNKDPVSRLNAAPEKATTFVDASAGTVSRRYYAVAVDALGQEGFPSAPVWYQREWQSFYAPFVGPWHQ